MKSFILRFLTALISYQAGESLIGTVVPDEMGPPSIGGVIDHTFNYQQYDFNRVAYMAFMCALLLLADRIGPKRSHIVWLALIAAFCGGYNYAISARDYLTFLDNEMPLYLKSVLPETIAFVVGGAVFFLAWFFPAVFLAVIKLASSPKFRARFALSGSKA